MTNSIGGAKDLRKLIAEHTPEAIRAKIQAGPRHSYLGDFVYGAVDGIVTTFAIVAGVAGAGFSHIVVIVLGMANLVADGFSMAVANFLATKSDQEMRERIRRAELRHIEQVPEGEREEIRQIYAAKGFQGDALEKAVETITADKDIWLETMLQEEFGLPKSVASPRRAAVVTFVAFFIVGLLPLLPYFVQRLVAFPTFSPFELSVAVTVAAFFGVGAWKGCFVEKRWYASGFETLFVGGCAAALAFCVGLLFRGAVT